jgi:hypothetical protein
MQLGGVEILPGISAASIRTGGPRAEFVRTIDPEALWQHSRNSVGIARLLLHERRPVGLLDTACRAAMEYACRAALHATGRSFSGDVARSLECLAAPQDLVGEVAELREDAQAHLAATERVLAWAADQLRRACPGRPWHY